MKVAILFLGLIVLAVAQAPPTQPAKPAQPAQPTTQQPAPQQAKQVHDESMQHPRQIPLGELKDLKFVPHAGTIRGSIATATDALFKSFLAREPATAGLFVTPHSVFVYKSLLPNGGVYKGMIGLLDFMYRSKLMFEKTSFSYEIGPIDEARGVSLVKMKYGGKFLRSGKSLESTCSVYICWRLGKIDKVALVNDDPKAVLEAYATPAEITVAGFWNAIMSCEAGSDCPEATKFLSPDIKYTVSMFPEAIGKRLSFTGLEGFQKMSKSADSKWLLDRITNIVPLYGDNTTAIQSISLGRKSEAARAIVSARHGMGVNFNNLPGAGLDVDSLADLRIIDVVKVKDGKIVSCDKQLSQPIMPWHLRTLGLLGLRSAAEVKEVVTSKNATASTTARPAETKPAEAKAQTTK